MCSSSITSFHFAWELQTGKLSHCGLRRGVLTHGSSSDQKKEEEKKKPLSAFVYHISEASITATMVWLTPERNWGTRLVKQRWKLCLVVNVRTSLDHTRSQCAICFLQCHHRLLHRDCLILSFLYSSERFSFSFFLYWDKLDTFIFVCIWLPT